METELALTILAILLLIFLSGLFSGSETALTTVSRPHIYNLARRGNRRAKLVRRLGEEKEMLIGGILFGNNLVNILASALATSIFIREFGEAGIAYATVVMTAIILIFAEILPKTYAISNPNRSALAVAPIIHVIVRVFSPVVRAAQFIVRLTLAPFGVSVGAGERVLSAAQELRDAIDLHTREGGLVKHEGDMLDSILDLADVDVSEIMIHRKNMMTVDATGEAARIIDQILASPFTRVPLWRDEPENIIGVLHVKNLLAALHENGGDFGAIDVTAICAEPWYVPETTPLLEQLGAFRKRHEHFALVVDEFGGLMGLVTLEDILEEIVGDIADEHDIAAHGIKGQPDGSYVVEGSLTVRDLNRHFDWELPEEEATTVAGLVIERAQAFPTVGQVFDIGGVRFEVHRRQRNQITALRLTPPRGQDGKTP